MAGELEIPKPIKLTNAEPVDFYYGPHVDVAAACTAVPVAVRKKGIRKVGIIQSDGRVVDYWWNNSTADNALIPYAPEIGNLTTDSTHRFVTDAEKQTIANQSGTNTGDETQTTINTKIGYTPYSAANPSGFVNSAQAASAAPVQSVNAKTGSVVLTKTDVGLGNADNTSDINKPVSTAQAAADALKVDKVAGKQLSTEDYTTAEKTKLTGIATAATANSTDAALRDRTTHTGTQSADTIIDGTTNKAYTAAEKTKLAGIATAATANSTDAALRDRNTHTDTQSADTIIDGTTNKAYTAAEKTKLAGIATAATANSTDAALRDRTTHTGTQSADTIIDGTTNKAYTAAEKTKLAGIATAATSNSTDANLRDRATHTGTQAAATISDFAATLRATVLTGLSTATNAVVSATDTVLSGFGKLQKQITDLLTTAQNVTGKFTFKAFINLFPASAPSSPANGDLWMETANNRFRAYKGTQSVDLITSADNYALVGTGQRVVSANAYGDLTASEAVIDAVVSDADLIAGITGATYNSGNKFAATINVAGKSVYDGQKYYDLTSGYYYLAVADNKILRLTGV